MSKSNRSSSYKVKQVEKAGLNNILLEQIEPYIARPVDDIFVNNFAAKIATHDYVAPLAVVPRGPKIFALEGFIDFLRLKS